MTSEDKGSTYLFRRLEVIRQIIRSYDGAQPLHRLLKSYFNAHRNFGSRDRRIYSDAVYAWFRLGHALQQMEFEPRLCASLYLTGTEERDWLGALAAAYLPQLSGTLASQEPLSERILFFNREIAAFKPEDILPAHVKYSAGIDTSAYGMSLLVQPLTWVRVRDNVSFQEVKIRFQNQIEIQGGTMYGFLPSTKLTAEETFLKGGFEIQDRSSQIAGGQIPASPGELWWDCCCGAGGKSIQIADTVRNVRLFCTDVRDSILTNFRERIVRNRIKTVIGCVALDVSLPISQGQVDHIFDGIVADVPCSGSGTWSRTPEMLSCFDHNRLQEFQDRQLAILKNVWGFLKPGGTLVYITCSVYSIENENVIDFFCSNSGGVSESVKLISGTEERADSMFIAMIKKPIS